MRHETAFGDRSSEAGLEGTRPLEPGAGALRAAVSENAIFANDIGLLADGALTLSLRARTTWSSMVPSMSN
jgi:hypothetical protein